MLRIRINNQYLSLPKDFSFGFEFVTNILNVAERNDNSFALPIRVPMNEQTAQIFGYSFDPQVQFDLSQKWPDCAVQINNNDYWLGAIELHSINDDEAKLNFRFASGYIPTVSKKSKLRDFFQERTIRIQGNTTNFYTLQWPLTEDRKYRYEVVINGTSYQVITNGAFALQDYWLQELRDDIIDLNVLSVSYDTDTNIMVIQSADNTALTITAEYEELDEVTITQVQPTSYSEFALIDNGEEGTKYELPPMHLPNLFDGRALNYTGFANTHDQGIFYKVPEIIDDIEVTLVPCIKTKWMLEQIFGDFGISVEGDFFDDAETSERLEFTPRSIDKEVLESDYTSGLDVTIPVAEFLPDITLSEYVSSLKQELCMSITFDPVESIAKFNLIEERLNDATYEDWTPYVVKILDSSQDEYKGHQIGFKLDENDQALKANVIDQKTFTVKPAVDDLTALAAVATPDLEDIRFVRSQNAFYKYRLERVGTAISVDWYFYAYNLDDDLEAEEELEIRSIYSPLIDTDVTINGREMRVPSAEVVGFLPQLDLTDNDFQPRFSIYRGVQKDLQNNDYKMASHNRYTRAEVAIAGSAKVFAPGVSEEALATKLFSRYIETRKDNRKVTMLLDLPQQVLQTFDQTTKKRIRGVNYMVLSLSGEISNSGPGTIQAVLQRLT